MNSKIISIILFCLISLNARANTTSTVSNISFNNEEKTLEISISSNSSFKAFTLKNPNRLAIDILNANIEENAKRISDFIGIVKAARFNHYKNLSGASVLRIAFDISDEVTIKDSKFASVDDDNSGKIIIALGGDFNKIKTSDKVAASKSTDIKTSNIDNSIEREALKSKTAVANSKKLKKRMPVIVIDAGHGGKDPGAIGHYARTKEKNITLAYARELAKRLMSEKKYKVYLTRDRDYFVILKNRVAKARKVKADLFISIHADSEAGGDASGLSIYTLSEKSSDKQAELLAAKENQADIISGINFSGASDDVVDALINLSQRNTMNSSSSYANLAIELLKDGGVNVVQNSHRFAGFMVLTAPDVTSVLIELGYLSNKKEENKLNSYSYRKKITKILADSVVKYFEGNSTAI